VQPDTQPQRAASQLVAQSVADRYAAIVAPFLGRLETQAQRIGYLEAELAAVTAERNRLQASPESPQDAASRASDMEAAPPESPVPATEARRPVLAVVVGEVEAASSVGAPGAIPSSYSGLSCTLATGATPFVRSRQFAGARRLPLA
jgi:hypothetical protein